MHVQELTPLVVEQRAVSLQRIVDRFPKGVFGLECHHLPEKFNSQEGWLASLPGKADLCRALGFNMLANVFFQNMVSRKPAAPAQRQTHMRFLVCSPDVFG